MRSRGGLTLIEMVVTVALFSILSGAIFVALEQSREVFQSGDLQVQLQQEARKGLDEFLKEVRESDSSTVTIYTYTDSIDGAQHEAIAFASARGDPAAAADSAEGACSGAANNSCFHTASGNPSWRSLVVYAFYQTGGAPSLKQLRRYADYAGVTYTDPVFPFTFQGISSTQITVRSALNDTVILTRGPDSPAGGDPRVVIPNSLEHEDQDGDVNLDANENDGSLSLPDDDRDGQLDYGARFSRNGTVVTGSIFLRAAPAKTTATDEFIVVSLEGSSALRN